jgi:1-acyl-sn-glycerol-3-phosphate acyltransferase
MTFPEDTRSRKGEIKSFKHGAFYLAIESGVPIVPVSIIGSGQIMPQKSLKIIPGQTKLGLGKPIEVKTFDIENRYELIEKVRNTIIKNYNYWQETRNSNIKDLESEAT